MNVVVNGLMTNYQKRGKGKTILLLPGWGDDSRTFTQLSRLLEDKYETVVLDLPGFGGTQPPPSAWSLEDYADFVERFMKKTSLKPYAVIGHSYGGAVAVVAASRRLIADRLILLAAAGVRNKNTARKRLLTAAAKIGKLPLMFLPERKRQAVKARFYGTLGSDIFAVPHMEQTFRKIIGDDVSERASRVDVPTLLIYGSEDKATPVREGHELNRAIRGSRMEVVGAGHFLHQEDPERIAQLIKSFLGTGSKDG